MMFHGRVNSRHDPNAGSSAVPPFRANQREAITAPDLRAAPAEPPPRDWGELRVAAMRFVTGASRAWTVDDLLAWTRAHLVGPGRMLGGADPPYFREPPLGIVRVGTASGARRATNLPEVDAGTLADAARSKVAATLRGLLLWPSQDAFLHGALFGGRVERVSDRAGGSRWIVRVTPDTPVSDQVLALFAADLLENRADYEATLNVCDTCQAVGFDAPSVARFGCREHPRG